MHSTSDDNVICQICGCDIIEDEKSPPDSSGHDFFASQIVYCRDCGTPHHEDCWLMTGCCSTFGCGGEIADKVRPGPCSVSDSPIVIDSSSEFDVSPPLIDSYEIVKADDYAGSQFSELMEPLSIILKAYSYPVQCIVWTVDSLEKTSKHGKNSPEGFIYLAVIGMVIFMGASIYNAGLSSYALFYLFTAAASESIGNYLKEEYSESKSVKKTMKKPGAGKLSKSTGKPLAPKRIKLPLTINRSVTSKKKVRRK
jgi:hypothetical protein